MNASQPLPYLDSHAHIQAPQFAHDQDAVLQRAREAGIGTIICASDDEASSLAAVSLAERHADVRATVGVHPHEAKLVDFGTFKRLAILAASSHVIAIGEIGLDYFRDLSPRAAQRDIFRRGLALASQLRLPVVIHSRDAAADTYAALQEWCAGEPADRDRDRGVIHCYSYDLVWAERFLALGFLVSIPGTVTYPSAANVRGVAAAVPDAMLLVETDAPYLSPQRWRGKRNEPAYLTETVSKIASIRGVDPVYLAKTTAANAVRLYNLTHLIAQTGSVTNSLRGTP